MSYPVTSPISRGTALMMFIYLVPVTDLGVRLCRDGVKRSAFCSLSRGVPKTCVNEGGGIRFLDKFVRRTTDRCDSRKACG